MKGRTAIIDRLREFDMAALVVDGELSDLYIAPHKAKFPAPGAVMLARVERILPATGGCFVRLPCGCPGYVRHASGLRAGNFVMLQASAYPDRDKALALTRDIRLRGPYAILTAGKPGISVSRKISSESERCRLRGIASPMLEGMDASWGLILRTASRSQDKLLRDDVAGLATLGRKVEEASEWTTPRIAIPAPTPRQLAYSEWIAKDGCQVDDYPGAARDNHLDDRIEEALERRFALPCGGNIYVDETRAVTAIDVNTGRQSGGNAAANAASQAARILPRLLRIRGIGGQIVVDFPSLRRGAKHAVEHELKSAFSADPVPTTLLGWTRMGLYEMHRKRDRVPLSTAFDVEALSSL